MVSAARTWALFKLIRIIIFSLSTILCMIWTALYIVLLIHGWSSFTSSQRVIVLILISIYGISSIFLYLMIVVYFRLWMDGARVVFLVLFQAGGTVAFFHFSPSLYCHNTGPEFTCKSMKDIVIFGGWSLCVFLLIYGFLLAVMSCVPVPPPPPDPEAVLAVKLGKEISLAKEKRQSTRSAGSYYSQSSLTPATLGETDRNRGPIISTGRVGPNYYRSGTPTSVRSIVPSILYPTDFTRVPSTRDPGRVGYNHNNRSGTPGSVRSTASTSSTRGLDGHYIYPSREPTPESSVRWPSLQRAQSPNELISRQRTLLSPVSYQSPRFDDHLYDRPHPRSLTPSVLALGVQPLYTSHIATIPLRSESISVPRSLMPQNLSLHAPIPATLMNNFYY